MTPFLVIVPLCFGFCALAYKISESWKLAPPAKESVPVLDCGHQSPRNKQGNCIECGLEDWREIFQRIPGNRWDKLEPLVSVELRKHGLASLGAVASKGRGSFDQEKF
jgi:hypothetical protein